MNKKGMITPNGVLLKEHENATVVFLTELGYNVELIPKSIRRMMVITKTGQILDFKK